MFLDMFLATTVEFLLVGWGFANSYLSLSCVCDKKIKFDV